MFQKGEVITLVARLLVPVLPTEFTFKALVTRCDSPTLTFVLHRTRPEYRLFLETVLCANGERIWITSLRGGIQCFEQEELFSENLADLNEYRSLEWPNNVVGHIYHVYYKTAYKETMTFLMASKYLPIDKNIVQIIARKLYVPDRVEIKF